MNRPFANLLRRRAGITLAEERGVRTLHFGSVWVQGAMRIADPFRLELEYTRELFAGLIFQPAPRAFTLIGLGAGSATKFAWKNFPRSRVTSVDIDPAVIACARTHFALPADSSRHAAVCADGHDYLAAHPHSTDYLIVDVYDARAAGPVLSSRGFYGACRDALVTDRLAVIAVNLFGRHKSHDLNFGNLEQAFDGRVLALPASARGNVIAFGFAGPHSEIALAELRRVAAGLKERLGLEFPRWLAGFRRENGLDGVTVSA
ncbi:MAG: spermidine synthase [Burkholderiales bacterium]|nr:spermidine synthase [Burkholderiales bacterium]